MAFNSTDLGLLDVLLPSSKIKLALDVQKLEKYRTEMKSPRSEYFGYLGPLPVLSLKAINADRTLKSSKHALQDIISASFGLLPLFPPAIRPNVGQDQICMDVRNEAFV